MENHLSENGSDILVDGRPGMHVQEFLRKKQQQQQQNNIKAILYEDNTM